jgi:hypothetical protein
MIWRRAVVSNARRAPISLAPPPARIFASHKLSFVDLLGAICLFVNASKGLSTVQLSRDPDVQYKTAFVLMHKLREAMASETAEGRLAGEVEIDGAYFGGSCPPHQREGGSGWSSASKES